MPIRNPDHERSRNLVEAAALGIEKVQAILGLLKNGAVGRRDPYDLARLNEADETAESAQEKLRQLNQKYSQGNQNHDQS